MRLSEADRAKVAAAVTAAEAHTNGEIVPIVARQSDGYHDVALHWAVLAMLLVLALLATIPGAAEAVHGLIASPWDGPPPAASLFLIGLVATTIAFLIVRLLLAATPLRLALTPHATKARRVRRRALLLFRTAVESRTRGATGVLLYLSLAEHRAELVADAPIHSRVAPEVWGEAMAVLIAAVKDDRPGDGLAAAIERIGAVLAEHFPRDADDINELPDRVIEV